MTPWELLQASEPARVIAFRAILFGLTCGAGLVAIFGWRRLTTPARADEQRILRAIHTEEIRRLTEQRDDARRQVREFHAQAARMAALYTTAAANAPGAVVGALADPGARKGAA